MMDDDKAKWASLAITSGLFSGFLPRKITGKNEGGGLAGSILGFIIQLIFVLLGVSFRANLITVIILAVAGCFLVPISEAFMLQEWGPRVRHTGRMANSDFNETNIDEVVGQMIAGIPVFLNPFIGPKASIFFLLVALVFFRFLDVNKPGRLRNWEKMLSKVKGVGVMFDDIMCGVITAVGLDLMIRIIRLWG